MRKSHPDRYSQQGNTTLSDLFHTSKCLKLICYRVKYKRCHNNTLSSLKPQYFNTPLFPKTSGSWSTSHTHRQPRVIYKKKKNDKSRNRNAYRIKPSKDTKTVGSILILKNVSAIRAEQLLRLLLISIFRSNWLFFFSFYHPHYSIVSGFFFNEMYVPLW